MIVFEKPGYGNTRETLTQETLKIALGYCLTGMRRDSSPASLSFDEH